MSTVDTYGHAVHTAHIWLADVAKALDTDGHHAHRILRAWLHTLRDRLTVHSAAKFAAQLPELLRGEYYDGWQPAHAPVTYHLDQYLLRFAAAAGIPITQVPAAAAAVTAALARHMTGGQLAEALAEFPTDLRATITRGDAPAAPAPQEPATGVDQRLRRLEDQVATLTEALRALAHGLDNAQVVGFDTTHAARAARLADEILLAAGYPTGQVGEPAASAS